MKNTGWTEPTLVQKLQRFRPQIAIALGAVLSMMPVPWSAAPLATVGAGSAVLAVIVGIMACIAVAIGLSDLYRENHLKLSVGGRRAKLGVFLGCLYAFFDAIKLLSMLCFCGFVALRLLRAVSEFFWLRHLDALLIYPALTEHWPLCTLLLGVSVVALLVLGLEWAIPWIADTLIKFDNSQTSGSTGYLGEITSALHPLASENMQVQYLSKEGRAIVEAKPSPQGSVGNATDVSGGGEGQKHGHYWKLWACLLRTKERVLDPAEDSAPDSSSGASLPGV